MVSFSCGGSRISQGAPTVKVGMKNYYLAIFPENYMKMKEIRPKGALGSATDYGNSLSVTENFRLVILCTFQIECKHMEMYEEEYKSDNSSPLYSTSFTPGNFAYTTSDSRIKQLWKKYILQQQLWINLFIQCKILIADK